VLEFRARTVTDCIDVSHLSTPSSCGYLVLFRCCSREVHDGDGDSSYLSIAFTYCMLINITHLCGDGDSSYLSIAFTDCMLLNIAHLCGDGDCSYLSIAFTDCMLINITQCAVMETVATCPSHSLIVCCSTLLTCAVMETLATCHRIH